VATAFSSRAAATPREIADALRVHFAEHNRRVAIFAAVSFVVSLLLWAVLYFVAQWLTLLFVTVVSEGTAPLPRGLPVVFATVAVSLLAYAWIDRRLTPDERPRDTKTFREIVADIVLAIPRATIGAWRTVAARQHLSESELALAATFLARLDSVGRIALPSVGYDLPEPATREKILFALQITGVIDVLPGKSETAIFLSAQRPGSLGLAASSAPSAATATRNEG
jgi:hypothetical protein